ncbi:class I SAM-dependent methyltransferase [Castellaniella defragrans]|uniref:class I SAM-dependent methyltransferase n=1 Tax=Castellaniella defragrans TaxID=75697 RepID=UPI002AFFABE8|nr:class I SAM-dependent methyltransferase [Castellaniella defragrans]
MPIPPTSAASLDNTAGDVNRDIAEAYDKRVYTSNAFSYASPGHLRAAAHLYGLDTVPLEKARVLELGCAGGGNLLPFALAYPQAQVVGLDLSSVQVAQGQELIQALNISNLRLHAMSLTDVTPEFGQFDYIIAHGVFSWVPPDVREAMLRILRDNLSPQGIGYISYNTYPGWKAGDIVRDAMLLHSHNAQSDEEKLASAKAMLSLLSDGIWAGNPLAPSLRAVVAQLNQLSDYYIAHEYLETFNNPCYLLEFVNLAQQYGLAHVGDADPCSEMSAAYGQNVQLSHSLVALGQPRMLRQQYLDFAIGRNFRKSLLVHDDRESEIRISPDMDRLDDLRWAGHFRPAPDAPERFQSYFNKPGRRWNTRDAVEIAIIQTLTEVWPASLDVPALTDRIRPALPQDLDEAGEHKAVLDTLQKLFQQNFLNFALEPTPYDRIPSADHASPALTPGFAEIYRRCQNPDFGIGTFNLWHESVSPQLKPAEAFLIPYLDGQHSRKQLAILLRDALNRDTVPALDGKSLKGQRNLDALADRVVNGLLDLLVRQGLLI